MIDAKRKAIEETINEITQDLERGSDPQDMVIRVTLEKLWDDSRDAALKHAEKDCFYRWQLGIKNTIQQWEGNEQVIQALREAAAEIRRLREDKTK